MKLFILVAFISLTLSNAFLLRPPDVPETDIADPTDPTSYGPSQGIQHYFTALFHSFELGRPRELLKCFEGKDSTHYFKYLSDVTELVLDTENRNLVKANYDWLELGRVSKALSPLWHCMMATKDFGDLLEALGDKTRDPSVFALVNYIYLQADYGKLAKSLPEIDKAIEKDHYWKAGALKADVLRAIGQEIKKKGLALVSLKAFWNGVHFGLDLPDAKSIYNCWDNTAAAVRLEFLYGMSKAVAEGKVDEAAINAVNWYEKEGQDIISKVSDAHWTCWRSSDDTKTESKKVGVDITTEDFYEKMYRFIRIRQDEFWNFQKSIKESLEEYNFVHAGAFHGKFYQAIADQK